MSIRRRFVAALVGYSSGMDMLGLTADAYETMYSANSGAGYVDFVS